MTQDKMQQATAPHPGTLEKEPFDFAKWWDRVGILVVLLAIVLLMASIAPNFARVDNFLNIARSISVNAILAAGLTFVILTTGIDLSVGSIVAVSGVASVLAAIAGIPAPAAILAGMAVGAVCGLVNGVLTAYLALAPFIVTLGSMTFLRGLAYTMTAGQPIVSSSLSFKELGTGYAFGIPIPVIVMAIVYLLAWFTLERTRYGRHIYAVGGNAEAAGLAGVRVKRIITSVYVIAGGCAGLAGVIFAARVISAQPTAGTGYELDAIAAVVLGGTAITGGRGHIVGTLIGALLLGVLNNSLNMIGLSPYSQRVVKGVILLVAVLIGYLRKQNSR